MNLNEVFCTVKLNDTLPIQLPEKYDHITNMINVHYNKSYAVHVIRTMIEFVTANPSFNEVFQSHCVPDLIAEYQRSRLIESAGVYESYLTPFTTVCTNCKAQLKIVFGGRPKMLLTLTRTYRACESD